MPHSNSPPRGPWYRTQQPRNPAPSTLHGQDLVLTKVHNTGRAIAHMQHPRDYPPALVEQYLAPGFNARFSRSFNPSQSRPLAEVEHRQCLLYLQPNMFSRRRHPVRHAVCKIWIHQCEFPYRPAANTMFLHKTGQTPTTQPLPQLSILQLILGLGAGSTLGVGGLVEQVFFWFRGIPGASCTLELGNRGTHRGVSAGVFGQV